MFHREELGGTQMKITILLMVWGMLLPATLRADVVKMCVEHWPPYTLVKDEKVVGGSTVELAREALKRIGHTLEVDYFPWKRCLDMVKTGERDAVADASASQTAEYKMLVGQHMTSLWSLAVWVRGEDSQPSYVNLDTYKGKIVGLVEGYDYPDMIKGYSGWKIDWSISDKMNLTKLEKGRIDLAISDVINTMSVVKENKLNVKYLHPSVVSDPLYVAFTQKKPELAKMFDASLGELVNDGTADVIYQKYIGEKYSVLNKVTP